MNLRYFYVSTNIEGVPSTQKAALDKPTPYDLEGYSSNTVINKKNVPDSI